MLCPGNLALVSRMYSIDHMLFSTAASSPQTSQVFGNGLYKMGWGAYLAFGCDFSPESPHLS